MITWNFLKVNFPKAAAFVAKIKKGAKPKQNRTGRFKLASWALNYDCYGYLWLMWLIIILNMRYDPK